MRSSDLPATDSSASGQASARRFCSWRFGWR